MTPEERSIWSWRENYARRMLRLDFEPLPATVFHSATAPVVEGIRAVNSHFSPGFTLRDAAMVKQDDDAFAFVIARSAEIVIDKPRQQARLGQGDAALLRIDEPGRLGAGRPFSYLAMMIPQAELLRRLPKASATTRAPLARSSQSLHLLRGYLRTLETGKQVIDPALLQTIQNHFYDLAALAVSTGRTPGETVLSAVAAARLAVAKDIVEGRLHDPDFSIGALSSEMQLSTRYVQRLFAMADTTFTDRILASRLERARDALLANAYKPMRVSDIALQVGFSDVSYFNRTFRRHFGASPSDMRATHIKRSD